MSIDNVNEENQKLYIAKLDEALDLGVKLLNEGNSSTEVVEKVIKVLEDSPLFNAGKGAVFANDGSNQMDASIMEGKTLNAGAVAGVTDIRNPISAARMVMENSKHVMLSGKGASDFAKSQGLEMAEPGYFFTEKRYNDLIRALEAEGSDTGHLKIKKMGTVGCVALDKEGNISAGTSTGGMTNKKYGRIGDSPIIGAGTYANNKTCGVSSTGHGEYFIRYNVAYDISALMEYKALSLEEASKTVIQEKLVEAGGNGGVICLDKFGNHSFQFNTAGMFRGFANSEGKRFTAIFSEE